jgi:hypothetical protein
MPSPLVFLCSIKLFIASCSVRGSGNRLNLGSFMFRFFCSSRGIL